MDSSNIYRLSSSEALTLISTFTDEFRQAKREILSDKTPEDNKEYLRNYIEKFAPLFNLVKDNSYGVHPSFEIIMIKKD